MTVTGRPTVVFRAVRRRCARARFTRVRAVARGGVETTGRTAAEGQDGASAPIAIMAGGGATDHAGKPRAGRAVVGAARRALVGLDRLDERVLPVAGRILDGFTARASRLRTVALDVHGLPGSRVLLGSLAAPGVRTDDPASGDGGDDDTSTRSRSDRVTPYGDGRDPVGNATASRVVVAAGRSAAWRGTAEPRDTAAAAGPAGMAAAGGSAGMAAAVGSAGTADTADTTAAGGLARRGLRGRSVIERSVRMTVLGVVSVIGVSAIAALARGPAGGRDLGQLDLPRMAVPALRQQVDPVAGSARALSGAPVTDTAPDVVPGADAATASPMVAGPVPVPAPIAVPTRVEEMPAAAILVGLGQREAVAGYLTAARTRLAAAARRDEPPGRHPDTYGVVSFPGYRTPEQALDLLRDLRTVRVFFRVPPDGTALSADVRDPLADIRTAFARAADADAAAAQAGTADVADVAAVDVGTADAGGIGDADARERAADEAVALRDSCACLYGAVVAAPAWRLAALADTEPVRLVDVAAADAPAGPAVFVPLRPEQW
ncbi:MULTISPECIES: hypothetical protein [Protofrankia]|uniref:SPOR domain-containing protein n=1 Tax=Protofrankia coriariae TaxID=1562887 RepID=A0ABR5F6N4_9ACTN|nr:MULTISPECIES: hypothetical protein [Protofrankia]KLL12391.1 hypothetical protein FrCorBMG51_05135 [Protofrankia coriariae]ONH37286.1 hypothetical protein BL254_04365 [Protofrankia sp. BMG5.30]